MTEEEVQQRFRWVAGTLPDALKAWREVWPTDQDHFARSHHDEAQALLRTLEEAMYLVLTLESSVLGDDEYLARRER